MSQQRSLALIPATSVGAGACYVHQMHQLASLSQPDLLLQCSQQQASCRFHSSAKSNVYATQFGMDLLQCLHALCAGVCNQTLDSV